jgi:2-oxoglutarate ferredoxin oxidoreductase subunit alpha
MAMFGRNGEAPVPIVAPQSPSDCFDAAIEACRIALKYRTPVFLLSDGYLANGSEPWRLPDVASCPTCASSTPPRPTARTARSGRTSATPRRSPGRGRSRDARARAPRRRHREAGRHRQHLVRPEEPRPDGPHPQAKVDGIARDIPPLEVDDPSGSARTLVLGWGSTYGPIGAAVRQVRARGIEVAQAHLRHINPFPPTPARCCGATTACCSPR